MPFILSLPLYIFLFAFLGFLVIFVIFIFFDLYHIFETNSLTIISLTVTILIFSVSALSLFFTWSLLQNVDWKTPVLIFDSSWITKLFTFN